MSYQVKYRRLENSSTIRQTTKKSDWTIIENVVGHSPEKILTETITTAPDGTRTQEKIETTSHDRMVFYLENGGVRTVGRWSECEILLDKDWAEYVTQYTK